MSTNPHGQGTVCQLCGRAEGHSPRCSVTKFGAPDMRMPDASVHTCHDECPCHTGGEPTRDFIEAEAMTPTMVQEADDAARP